MNDPLLFLTFILLQKPVVGNEHFTVENIVYNEDNGLCDVLHWRLHQHRQDSPGGQQYGQMHPLLTLYFPCLS